jgi:dolichol kinase
MDSLTSEVIRVGGLAAVSVWGIMQALKPLISKHVREAWHRAAVRGAALAVGGVWGYLLKPTTEGAILGVCGAALSATVVATIKQRIKGGAGGA